MRYNVITQFSHHLKYYADLRASLCETEDVVNEQQHILTLLVTEVLGHGQSSQSHSGTGTRGLVHLTVHQRHLEMESIKR